MKVWELVNLVLSTLVSGMFWGPWLALSRSMKQLEPTVFLAVVHRMNLNMAAVMTVLMPVALLSAVPVLVVSYGGHPREFYLALTGLVMFVVALVVTMRVEVPIVKQIETWTESTLPADWQRLRDRWGAFHIVRIVASLVGLGVLMAGAVL
jgi:uncharacterized membrane protein